MSFGAMQWKMFTSFLLENAMDNFQMLYLLYIYREQLFSNDIFK